MVSVNLPRWGLKLVYYVLSLVLDVCVNLPRWGLKQIKAFVLIKRINSVNLPRWGLKPLIISTALIGVVWCKFTPLGFET